MENQIPESPHFILIPIIISLPTQSLLLVTLQTKSKQSQKLLIPPINSQQTQQKWHPPRLRRLRKPQPESFLLLAYLPQSLLSVLQLHDKKSPPSPRLNNLPFINVLLALLLQRKPLNLRKPRNLKKLQNLRKLRRFSNPRKLCHLRKFPNREHPLNHTPYPRAGPKASPLLEASWNPLLNIYHLRKSPNQKPPLVTESPCLAAGPKVSPLLEASTNPLLLGLLDKTSPLLTKPPWPRQPPLPGKSPTSLFNNYLSNNSRHP
jgi:hypothetical protein